MNHCVYNSAQWKPKSLTYSRVDKDFDFEAGMENRKPNWILFLNASDCAFMERS